MSKPLIRYLRMYCATPAAQPEFHRDGVLAIASIREHAGLARVLLADMGQWQRNGGATVTNAVDVLVRAAHRTLIAGFGIPLGDTLVATWDSTGNFDQVHEAANPAALHQSPMRAAGQRAAPRSRDAFLAWAGVCGHAMLAKAESVGAGAWAGAEG